MALQDYLEQLEAERKPIVDAIIAQGRPAEKGRDATFRFAIDMGDGVGELRADGSVDFKNRNIFQSVKKGQLLVIKQPPVQGADGLDVCGNILPGKFGNDHHMAASSGVDVSENGLEYRAAITGIVEAQEKSIRVIPGLFIPTDVGNKTGNIHGAAAQVFIKGNVLPDFEVTSESDISIEKDAEACRVTAKGNLNIRGGIIGKGKGFYSSKLKVDAQYINGATVECEGDIVARSEIVASQLVTGSWVLCEDGAGTIVSGDITTFNGVKARILGSAGSESKTTIHLGVNLFMVRAAQEEIRAQGLEKEGAKLEDQIKELSKELQEIYDSIPETTKRNVEEGQKLQNRYKGLHERRQELLARMDVINGKKAEIMSQAPINKDFLIHVSDIIHPGTTFVFGEVRWTLKEPVRGVEIRWNAATSNFTSKRI